MVNDVRHVEFYLLRFASDWHNANTFYFVLAGLKGCSFQSTGSILSIQFVRLLVALDRNDRNDWNAALEIVGTRA